MQGLLGSLDGFLSGGFVQVGSTLHGVGKNLDHVRLNLEETTRDVEHLFFPALLGQTNRTWLQAGDQRCVPQGDTKIPQLTMRNHKLDQTGENFPFRTDDIAMDCHSHLIAST
ncbi:conserved protein of unknown function [Pseudomonas mediterranea]